MKRIAVVGSGPSALYTVKYILKRIPHTHIDIYEKLCQPFGLVRFGVAPDHPEVKNVAHEFTDLLNSHTNLKLHLNQNVSDVQALKAQNDAVLVATGAQGSKKFPVPYRPHHTARDFVLWYNGHPEGVHPEISPEKSEIVSVVGMGNVALDVARMLSKGREALAPLRQHGLAPEAFDWLTRRQTLAQRKTVKVFARRGYEHAAFTNKEFRELLHIEGAATIVDPADLGMSFEQLEEKVESDRAKKRGLEILQHMIKNFEKKVQAENMIELKFNSELREQSDLLISSVGFQVKPMAGLPMNPKTGGVENVKGRVTGVPGLYVVGWAKRGPVGNIASNIPDATETAEAIVEDLGDSG